MSEINTVQLLEEADGYRELGLYDEAEAALRSAMVADPSACDAAQIRLMRLLRGRCRFHRVANLGAELIARGVYDHGAILDTALALHCLARVKEAREALGLMEKCHRRVESEAYQMACFASRLKEFSEAMRWLALEFRQSPNHHVRSMTEIDLMPFWAWLREGRFSLDEAHMLTQMPFKDVCTAAKNEAAPIELSATDLANVVQSSQRLFRFDFMSGYFVLSPLAVSAHPKAAATFLRGRRMGIELVEAFIREGHQRAADMVLDAQPRYAAEHTAWGNHLGARYHMLWAMNLRPSLVLDFHNEPGLEMMHPVWEELVCSRRHDPAFVERIGRIPELVETDRDAAWKLLHETPDQLRETGLFQIRLGALYHAEREYEIALTIWEKLRQKWPLDAAGFLNAALALRALGRDSDAKRILVDAPPCCRRFRLFWEQIAALEGTEIHLPPRGFSAFRGQPDLGGLLLPASWLDKGDPVALEPTILPAIPLTAETLTAFVRRQPGGRITVGIVYVEDTYETMFGDGYYSYPQRAFFSFRAAQRCAAWVNHRTSQKPFPWRRAEAKEVEIVLGDNEKLCVPAPQGVEELNWEEIRLLALFNGDDFDWKSIAASCAGDEGFIPNFENEDNDLDYE